MDIRVRIRGIDNVTRAMARASDATLDGAHDGCTEAAQYLKGKIEDKIGVYQDTGGPGGGPWPSLKLNTIKRHIRRGGGDTPLLYTGNMRDSFYVQAGGKHRLAAQVKSSCDYLIYHIYGVPRANLPQRDPMKCTAKEEAQKCTQIIRDSIKKVLGGGKL